MNDKEKVFLGRITAGMTHEINNVWATIREAAGLMNDLMTHGPAESFPHRDKLISVSERIGRQVSRGIDLTKRLNGFAHSMDFPEKEVILADAASLVVDLNQRFARLKKVELASDPWRTPQEVRLSPFHLLLIVSDSLAWLLEHTSSGGKIIIRPPADASATGLEIEAQPISGAHDPEEDGFQKLESHLKEVMDGMGAKLTRQSGDGRIVLLLTLPPMS